MKPFVPGRALCGLGARKNPKNAAIPGGVKIVGFIRNLFDN
jgi:hypothetical protein